MNRIFIPVILVSLTSAAYGLEGPVRTESGLVSGAGAEITVFKGIPFAASTAGELRWKPPEPPKPWDGVREATKFGAACPQSTAMLKIEPLSEDCLNLNIWTPAKTSRDRLPVMLSIHGGGFFTGAGFLPAYNGEALARQGVVVVTFNYRVGVLGFMAHPELSAESPRHVSGNYGLLDQIAALQWVHRNIAAFGGDPKRVTIFGESAGGSSVCYLMVSPLARGLFQRAISQSAAWIYTPTTHLRERRFGRTPAEEMGVKLGTLATLRALSAQEMVKLAPSIPDMLMDPGSEFRPVVDGWVLPDDPDVLYETGRFNKAAFLAGTNADEGTVFSLSMGNPIKNLADLKAYAEKRYGSADLLPLYPAVSDAEALPAFQHMLADTLFLYGTHSAVRAVSRRQSAYWYQFTRVNGLGKMIKLGASHGMDIGYTFGNLGQSIFDTTPLAGMLKNPDRLYDDTDKALAKTMSAVWVQFARTGNPNGPGLLVWPRYRETKDEYLEFGDKIEVKAHPRAAQLEALAKYFAQIRAEGAEQATTR
jgi:para-nitrobenzyl esterase